jgi:hypothetical protein
MINDLNRRQAIEAGLAVAGGLLLPQSVGAKPDPEEGQLPDSSVPTRIIKPATHPEARDPRLVSDETWLIHQLSMHTVEDEGPRELHRMREIPEYSISIDDEKIEHPDRFWSDINRDGQNWRLVWKYAHPPQPPGKHRFKVTIDFPIPLKNKRSDGTLRVWDGTCEFGSIYGVQAAQDLTSSNSEMNQLQIGDPYE